MKGYGQICPVSRAVEILGERWTLLIVRALLQGEQNFNSLRKSMTGISPTLLSERLKTLESVNVIERVDADGVHYRLTEAGTALQPVLAELGRWGAAYTASNVADPDQDMAHLLWDLPRRLDFQAFVADEVLVYRFCVDGAQYPEFFLLISDGKAKIAFKLPRSLAPSLTLRCDLATLGRLWLAEESFEDARRSGHVDVDGEDRYWRMLTAGLLLNTYSALA